MSKTVIDMLTEYLQANGYGGLAGDECGCTLEDLCPCVQPDLHQCVAGKVVKDGKDFLVVPAEERVGNKMRFGGIITIRRGG